jgi:hypothetical protein
MNLVGPMQVTGIPVKLNQSNISLILSMLVEAKEKISSTPKGVIHML